jgi:prephenate dehydrogenase
MIADRLACYFSDDNISPVRNADIVIYSVPIALTEKII